jgi:chromosome segregation ATPase
MKSQTGVIILAVVCAVLGIALIGIKMQDSSQHQKDTDSITTYSNRLVRTSADLDDQRTFAAALERDLEGQKKSYLDLTNSFSKVSADLVQTSETLSNTQTQLAEREARITDLETQNKALDQHAADLSNSITNLTTQIGETQRKLVASEGDRAFLEKELKRLMAEKAELERQFNDLTVLRAQVSRLKEELSIARRMEWIRQGLFAREEQKGAQKLMQGLSAPQTQAKAPKPSYDLNVEVTADGSVKVIPALTNSPAASPPAQ